MNIPEAPPKYLQNGKQASQVRGVDLVLLVHDHCHCLDDEQLGKLLPSDANSRPKYSLLFELRLSRLFP